uniref:Uncharacterized protein n=1 Tax=Anguilla anguilla TaxID=7936 RepID=A0A0E9QDW6_ANGAN
MDFTVPPLLCLSNAQYINGFKSLCILDMFLNIQVLL